MASEGDVLQAFGSPGVKEERERSGELVARGVGHRLSSELKGNELIEEGMGRKRERGAKLGGRVRGNSLRNLQPVCES